MQRFTANGASPAWHAEVDGDVMTFEVPPVAGAEGSPRRVAVERLAYAHGANFSGRDGNVDVVLDINGTACRKTGAEREFTATLHYGSHTFHGCADAAR